MDPTTGGAPVLPTGGANDLEFRDFNLSNQPQGAGYTQQPQQGQQQWQSVQVHPETPRDYSQQQQQPFGAPGEPVLTAADDGLPGGAAQAANKPFYSIEYYMRFFDVDTPHVLNRMRHALLPIRPTFFDTISPNPDLYGPFWIASTVVFVLFVTGNLAKSVVAYENDAVFEPDFTQLSVAATTVYGYASVIPILLWLVLRYYHMGIALIDIICLYGYALVVFIPVSIICVAPYDWLKWTFTMIAFAESAYFMAINIWSAAKATDRRIALFVCIVVVLLHLGLSLAFKFVFFTYSPLSFPTLAPPATTEVPTDPVPTNATLAF